MDFEQYKPGVEICHIPFPDETMSYGAGFLDKSGWELDQTDCVTEHFSLVYILRGKATYSLPDGQSWKLSAGDYFLREPEKSHTTRIDKESHYLECFIVISRKLYDTLREIRIIPETPVGTVGVSPDLIDRFDRLRKMFRKSKSRNPGILILACQELLIDFFTKSTISRQKELYRTNLIKQACQLLEKDFDKPCDLQDFCRQNGCNYHTFRRMFQQEMMLSPQQYRTHRRLDRAAALLLEQQLTVAEIAWSLGYSSPFEFSARFKAHFGLAPLFFRRKY